MARVASALALPQGMTRFIGEAAETARGHEIHDRPERVQVPAGRHPSGRRGRRGPPHRAPRELRGIESGLGERHPERGVEPLTVRDQADAEAEALRVPDEARQARSQRGLTPCEAEARAAGIVVDDVEDAANLVVGHDTGLAPSLGKPGDPAAGVAEGAGEGAAGT